MINCTVKPPSEFLHLQGEIQKLQDTPYDKRPAGRDLRKIHRTAEICLCDAFGFRPAIRSGDKVERVVRSKVNGSGSWLIDHHEVYRGAYRWPIIILSQPYRILKETDADVRTLEAFGCEIVLMPGWEFYYPGENHASCFAIVVGEKAFMAMSYEKSDFYPTASKIFQARE